MLIHDENEQYVIQITPNYGGDEGGPLYWVSVQAMQGHGFFMDEQELNRLSGLIQRATQWIFHDQHPEICDNQKKARGVTPFKWLET